MQRLKPDIANSTGDVAIGSFASLLSRTIIRCCPLCAESDNASHAMPQALAARTSVQPNLLETAASEGPTAIPPPVAH